MVRVPGQRSSVVAASVLLAGTMAWAPPAAAQAVPAEAVAWAQEKDVIAAAQQQRPYQHLTVDELREVEELTTEEWFDELRARGIIGGGFYGQPQPLKPVARVPGALDRFLKERRGQG